MLGATHGSVEIIKLGVFSLGKVLGTEEGTEVGASDGITDGGNVGKLEVF